MIRQSNGAMLPEFCTQSAAITMTQQNNYLFEMEFKYKAKSHKSAASLVGDDVFGAHQFK